MFTFGYKTKLGGIIRALLSIAIGLVMVIGADATQTVVKIIACFVMAAGVVSLIVGLTSSKDRAPLLSTANAVFDCILGLILFMNPAWFSSFIVVVIGAVLIIFGIIQLIAFTTAVSLLGGGRGFLLLSVLAVLGGALLIFSPFSLKVMRILAGLFLLFYGVSELISSFRMNKAKEAYEIRYASDISSPGKESGTKVSDAKEVEFRKIDD
ncbi:MAG: HdeD family acid-resistance protein [Candidatus Cryptobacteroides sp.]